MIKPRQSLQIPSRRASFAVAAVFMGFHRYLASTRLSIPFSSPGVLVHRSAHRETTGNALQPRSRPASVGSQTFSAASILAPLAVCASLVRRRSRHVGSASRAIATASAADDSHRGAHSPANQNGPRVVFVIGGPGSGKGTQCQRIADQLGYQHLSAGELLRAERERPGSSLGAEIEETIRSGRTVPSSMIADILEKAMREAGWSDGRFVIDGYPRSAEQLSGWENTLSSRVQFQFCISIDVRREEMRKRLLGRALTSGRLDDNAETIEKRFATFEAETGPLLDHFDSKGLLRRVDGAGDVDDVWGNIRQLFTEATVE